MSFVLFFVVTSVTRAENYARVCVTTIDADSNESILTDNSLPSPAKRLVVHLDANTECVALIVLLTENGSRLANGWRPQMVLLPQWTEKTLPDSFLPWKWSKAGDPFELWLFFFRPDAPELKGIEKLVAAMQRRSLEERVLVQQTRLLCHKLSSRMNGTEQVMPKPKAGAALVGGSMRGVEFPWRDYARKVPLNDVLEGELVLRHGR